ncbi:hypothetical protein [Catenulispora subtropica]|uniref:hypothetical protein n=1 Tax=Catenulispora subtropica TaxID=450798 RepID=UPI0031CF55F8
MSAALGRQLTPGTYANAAAEPATAVPTVDIYGGGQSCTVRTGSFTIIEDDVDATGNLLDLNLTFDIKCQVNPVEDPSLVGYVRYHASEATPIPAIPTPPTTSTPPSATEPIKLAVRAPDGWPPAPHKPVDLEVKDIMLTGTLSAVHITAADLQIAITSIPGNTLRTGLYTDTTRHSSASGVGGGAGLDISVDGTDCTVQDGRMTIYELHADAAGNVDRFSANFSQMECDKWISKPGMHLVGFVRYHASSPTPLPWQ